MSLENVVSVYDNRTGSVFIKEGYNPRGGDYYFIDKIYLVNREVASDRKITLIVIESEGMLYEIPYTEDVVIVKSADQG